jgi:hypothetical protein
MWITSTYSLFWNRSVFLCEFVAFHWLAMIINHTRSARSLGRLGPTRYFIKTDHYYPGLVFQFFKYFDKLFVLDSLIWNTETWKMKNVILPYLLACLAATREAPIAVIEPRAVSKWFRPLWYLEAKTKQDTYQVIPADSDPLIRPRRSMAQYLQITYPHENWFDNAPGGHHV